VIVFVSPMKTGRIDSRWREVMDQQNLIYIAANRSANKMATIRRMVMTTRYPEVFTGAYICGVDFWKKDQTPRVDRLIQNRFVFLTGTRDFNRKETRQIRKRYIKAGAKYTKLIEVPGMGHKHPDATYLTEALQFLYGQD